MARDQSAERADKTGKREVLQPADEGTNFEREVRAILLMGRRNLDTIFDVNRLAADCMLRCALHQSEGCEKFSTKAFKIISELRAQADGSNSTVADSPNISDMLEVTMRHMRELSEVITRANREALDLVSGRAEECFKEIEEIAKRNVGTLMDFSMHPPMFPGSVSMLINKNRDQ